MIQVREGRDKEPLAMSLTTGDGILGGQGTHPVLSSPVVMGTRAVDSITWMSICSDEDASLLETVVVLMNLL